MFDTAFPPFDPDAITREPSDLAAEWIDDAIAAGIPEPHAGVWVTLDASGAPTSRTLIVKDITAEGFWCATPATTSLGRATVADPRATLHFYWPTLGRQLRVLGDLAAGPPDVSAADWAARSAPARSVGDGSTWTAYVLQPAAIEFFAAQGDRGHRRARYQLSAKGWTRMRPSTRFERSISLG